MQQYVKDIFFFVGLYRKELKQPPSALERPLNRSKRQENPETSLSLPIACSLTSLRIKLTTSQLTVGRLNSLLFYLTLVFHFYLFIYFFPFLDRTPSHITTHLPSSTFLHQTCFLHTTILLCHGIKLHGRFCHRFSHPKRPPSFRPRGSTNSTFFMSNILAMAKKFYWLNSFL